VNWARRRISESDIEQALDKAGIYIASRQCRNGGFCYYRIDDLEEPNLRDTYYAVAACRLLNREISNRSQVVNYVRSMGPGRRQSSYLYYYAFTAHLLGEAALDQALLHNVSDLHITPPQTNKNVPLSGWLEDSLQVIRLKKTFIGYAEMDEIAGFVRRLAHSGGVGAKPNLMDTYLAVSILAELDELSGLEKTKDFIDGLQLNSFGFRCTEDSLSPPSIDILYAGVLSCAYLGLKVRYVSDIVSSVLMSQRIHGGFARSPDSLGDLTTHFEALWIIQHLRSSKLLRISL
jgi:hypothetical protein